MIVTIDGPAGAGKSSVAKELAERLGFHFLDTGAMYRAVAWAAIQANVRLDDVAAVANIARSIMIDMSPHATFVDGVDVSEAIRSAEITEAVKFAAGNEQVRELLVEQQRRIGAAAENLVTEGRDQGSVVFPDAECKIFLTATPEQRAKRRYLQLLKKGEDTTFADVLNAQNQRDARDAGRDVAPLTVPQGSVEVYTDEMTQAQVVNHLAWIVESARPN